MLPTLTKVFEFIQATSLHHKLTVGIYDEIEKK